MTISPLDTELMIRGHEYMANVVSSTPYLKHMHPPPVSQTTTVSLSTSNTSLHDTQEMDFLSEFLMQEEFETASHDMKVDVVAHNDASFMRELDEYDAYSPHSSSSSTIEGTEPLDRKAKRRQQVAISARRHRSRKKNELLDLRKEVTCLTSQLHSLRSKHKMMRPNPAVAEWEEKAMAQRRKRRQAEEQSEELRRAIFLQGQFFTTMKSVFSGSPMFTEDVNMRQLLHTYTRLGSNPRSRERDFEAVCAESKLHLAMDIIRRQTQSIRFSTPYVQTQVIETSDVFGTTTVLVCAFETLDVGRTFGAMVNAIKLSSNAWPQFQSAGGERQVVDAVPKRNIMYGKQTTSYRGETTTSNDEIIVESRVVSSWQVIENEAMLLWDFVDGDDLHPPQSNADIRRDVVGACLVRRELCEDGKERVVSRVICSKLHSRIPSSASADNSVLTDFSTSPSRTLVGTCGAVVVDCVKPNLATIATR